MIFQEARRAMDDPKQDVKYGDDEWLAKQWAYFNRKYFKGELKKPKAIYWTKSRGRFGCCGHDFDGKKMYTTKIEISTMNSNYLTFKNTMVHEMVHQWVVEHYSTKEAIKRANSCGMARSRKWWQAMHKEWGDGSDSHHGTWLRKCDEIMRKDSSLNLKKYGSEDETPLTTRQKNKIVKANGKTHVVMQEGDPRTPRRHFYFITDKCFKRLQEEINKGERGGQWTEYEFDAAKMASEIQTPGEYIGNRYWSGSYFDNLCERGIINKWKRTYLGGKKTEHHRRSRRSLFGSWF